MPLSGLLVQALVDRAGISPVRSRLSDVFAAAAGTEPYATVAQVYDHFLTGHAPTRQQSRTTLSVHLAGLETFATFMMPPIVVHDLADATEDTPDQASIRGLLKRFLGEPAGIAPAWDAALASIRSAPPAVRDAMLQQEADTRFFDRIIDQRKLTMPDPQSGDAVACRDSVMFGGVIYYLFRGSEPWILAAGTHFNRPLLAWYPRRAELYRLYGIRRTVDDEIARLPLVLARLLHRLASFALRPPPPPARPPGPVLVVGSLGNPAHHLWNFLGGLERLRISGKLERVGRIIHGGTEFYGPIDEIFPQLRGRVEHPANPVRLDLAPMDPDSPMVGVGGAFIPRTLTARVIGLMKARPRATFAEPGDFEVGPGGRIVWLGLRVGDKAWLGQKDGLAAIIHAIEERHPGSVFLLDGYSHPVGRDLVSARWAERIAGLRHLAEEVAGRCDLPGRVVNAVGNTLREAVLWADACDAYLAPFGTAQHKVAWFSRQPGVVYVGPGFDPGWPDVSPGAIASETAARPVFVFGSAPPGSAQPPPRRANMEIDTSALLEPLLRLLAAPRRTRDGGTVNHPFKRLA